MGIGAERYDFVVVGAGIFGCYAAIYLANKGAKVALIEKEKQLFRKASLVNQARLHSGYHYPRSIATAALSDEHKARFTAEHRDFVHSNFEKFYAIDRFGSFTDAQQFERFCKHIGIRCDLQTKHPLFNHERLEALYLTEEHSFDPVLMGAYYDAKVRQHPNIHLITNSIPVAALADDPVWQIEVADHDDQEQRSLLHAPTLINATYAATNSINGLFGVDELALTHELSEMAYISSPLFKDKGLTVMDGPFGSIMPYGKSGLLTLSSVAYTHHKISYERLPRFDCQSEKTTWCKPNAPGICTDCTERPTSNVSKMLSQMRVYFQDHVKFNYFFSYFTIKTKLKSSYIDDGRPTEIALLRQNPAFYCLFSGKINSIYEIEKML
jgi:FAD dependent oxidoreductase